MSFIQELETTTNKSAQTENGAISNNSTLDPVLDFFSKAGAMRNDIKGAVKLFEKAFAADKTNAMRCLFYLRDVRGGQGERAVFRACLDSLDQYTVDKVVQFIPEYGRWDEVPFTKEGLSLIRDALNEDLRALEKDEPVSLLAKWLPSENTSSPETRKKARQLMDALGMKPRQYRKALTELRTHIKLLEQSMSAKEWAAIQYDKIPSQAHRKHIKAFQRNDGTRYQSYLDSVEKGEKKINTSTLFTYEVFELMENDYANEKQATANAMWANLPDFTNGDNALVVADVSGSMSGRPMAISVSLALYFAERNKGLFKDYFLTFSENSKLQHVRGDTLYDKMASIERADWDMSTNIQSAFDAILTAAKRSNASPDEMPKILYIISDMQFNVATGRNDQTNFEVAQQKFNEAGYELPHVVFWNCNAYGNDSPATKYDNHVTLISGSSQSTFQYVLAGKTPMESMLDILSSDRYNKIVV